MSTTVDITLQNDSRIVFVRHQRSYYDANGDYQVDVSYPFENEYGVVTIDIAHLRNYYGRWYGRNEIDTSDAEWTVFRFTRN